MKIYTKLTRRASVLGLLLSTVALLGAKGCDNPNPMGVTDTGSVVGRVVDAAHTDQALDTATISIGGIVRRLSPADKGGFAIENVPAGDNQPLHIDAPGYQPYNTNVIVHKGQKTDVGVIGLASSTGL